MSNQLIAISNDVRRLVRLLEGNGSPGLVKECTEVKVRQDECLRQHERERAQRVPDNGPGGLVQKSDAKWFLTFLISLASASLSAVGTILLMMRLFGKGG